MPAWADWDIGAPVDLAITIIGAENIRIAENGSVCLSGANSSTDAMLYAIYPAFDLEQPSTVTVDGGSLSSMFASSMAWPGIGTPVVVFQAASPTDDIYSVWSFGTGWVDQISGTFDWFVFGASVFPRIHYDKFGNFHAAAAPADRNDSNRRKLHYSKNGAVGTDLGISELNQINVLGIAVDPNNSDNIGILYYRDESGTGTHKVYFVKSTNGGSSFGAPVVISAYTDNTFDTGDKYRRGALAWGNGVIVVSAPYLTGGADDDDIEWAYSDDAGVTWSAIQQDLVDNNPDDKIKLSASPDGNTILFYQTEPVSGSLYVMIKTWDDVLDTWSTALAPFDILSDGSPPTLTGTVYMTGVMLDDGTARFALYDSGTDKVYRRDYGTFEAPKRWTDYIETFEV